MNTRQLISSDLESAGLVKPLRIALSAMSLSPCWLIALYRVAHALTIRRVPLLPNVLRGLGQLVWGADIWPGAVIGPGFRIAHPVGIVVGSGVVAGSDLHLFSGVVLGGSARFNERRLTNQPLIGDRVTIAANAVVVGGISIGDDVVVGANACVLDDVPSMRIVRAPMPSVEVRRPRSADRHPG